MAVRTSTLFFVAFERILSKNSFQSYQSICCDKPNVDMDILLVMVCFISSIIFEKQFEGLSRFGCSRVQDPICYRKLSPHQDIFQPDSPKRKITSCERH